MHYSLKCSKHLNVAQGAGQMLNTFMLTGKHRVSPKDIEPRRGSERCLNSFMKLLSSMIAFTGTIKQ